MAIPALSVLHMMRGWIANSLTRRRVLRCQMLDPRFAADIGLTPAQIEVECRRPFWAAFGLSREENPFARPVNKMPVVGTVVGSRHARAA